MSKMVRLVEMSDGEGLGGDESFCEHGQLLWSEDCDECDDALQEVANQITAGEARSGEGTLLSLKRGVK